MAKRKVIKSVLRGFLGTYMSRYSDYHGYWLFGFLVSEQGQMDFDLLGRGDRDARTPLAFAEQLAATKFEDQARKASLDPSQIQEARLRISRSPDAADGLVNGHTVAGFNFAFKAFSVMDDGRRYECEQVVFVARHDPIIELRSMRDA
jgi:hypothetical protein